MSDNNSFGRASAIMAFAVIGGQAVHWLINPANHPDASTARTIAVVVQAVACFGVALWLARQSGATNPRR